jgi:hypothetical protein
MKGNNSTQFKDVNFGTTFSAPHSKWLFGDKRSPKLVLTEIAFNLNIKNYRLEAYWNIIQKNNSDELNTDSLDWQLKIMEDCRAQNVILCLGRKVPHWPEYHIPNWAKHFNENKLKEKLLEYISKLIAHFSNDSRITAFQVENEVFYKFGLGNSFTKQEDFLRKEIEAVRKNDKMNRKIIITQAGDVNTYIKPAKDADILGLSYYGISLWKGFYLNHYGIRLLRGIETPQKWRKKIKSQIGNKKAFLTELQAEPWVSPGNKDFSIGEFNKSMSVDILRKNIKFVVEAGFKDVYFWGAEWWLWMADNGYPEIWQEIKSLLALQNTDNR